ncbi:hypothetical protein [Kitasatospora sp. NPDC088346]|uniref:hypothetical protein n=1 Tax=Kitasatospora sp. NPDC088346 TaxID=3364073 RepID=UPI003812BEE0
MSTPSSQRPVLRTRFGPVPRLAPPRPGSPEAGSGRAAVLRAAAERGARAGLWLSALASRRPHSEAGDALTGMAEATTFVLMAFGRRLAGLTDDERTVLLAHLDPYLGPAGSLLAPLQGQHLGVGDLTAAVALTAATRTALAMATTGDWVHDLPALLEVIDHILDQADAPPLTEHP